jgi:ABC-type uncharacterized transport system substrate-binding protein
LTAANLSALRPIEEAARALGVQLRRIDINAPDQIAAGFETATSGGADALVVVADAMFWNERERIVALAAKYRMPVIYPEREYVDDGGLLAYGRNVLENGAARRGMSTRSSRVRNPAICRSSSRPNSSWWSTSRPRRRWG